MRESPIRVAITQPYVPRYRYRLWDLVIAQLAEEGLEGHVFFGSDSEDRIERDALGDAVSAPWATQVPTRTWRISKRLPKIINRRIPRDWRDALLVTEMQATNVNAWRHLITRRPYVTFGHGRSGTTSNGGLSTALKARLNRSAHHVITYTEEGRSAVIAAGALPPERVTAFGNATDTVALLESYGAIGDAEMKSFNETHGIQTDAKIAVFIGALRENKRIDLLCESFLETLRADPDWWLVVAGSGPERDRLAELARKTKRVVLLGHATIREYGPAAKQASLIVNPGRIGLIAVDALAIGLPILTAPGAELAPEAEYLQEGSTLKTSLEPTPSSFSSAWTSDLPIRRTKNTRSEIVPSVEWAAERISSAIIRTNERRTRQK